MPLTGSHRVIRDLVYATTIRFLEPNKENYLDAIDIAEESNIGLNDALAYVLMRSNGIAEIYTFDRHFDQLTGIKRISQ